jgi:hypothetical protein
MPSSIVCICVFNHPHGSIAPRGSWAYGASVNGALLNMGFTSSFSLANDAVSRQVNAKIEIYMRILIIVNVLFGLSSSLLS